MTVRKVMVLFTLLVSTYTEASTPQTRRLGDADRPVDGGGLIFRSLYTSDPATRPDPARAVTAVNII